VERALADASVERLRVGPLSLAALHGLFRARLGRVFDRPTLVRIERVSGGNPLFAMEIARELLEAPLAAGEALPAPRSVGELVGARIRRLPAHTREELLAAAALSRPSTELVDPGSLEPAERAGLVSVEPDGAVSFGHPVFGSAVYAAAAPVQRRAVHRRACGAGGGLRGAGAPSCARVCRRRRGDGGDAVAGGRARASARCAGRRRRVRAVGAARYARRGG
jgi:hypothetical protein